jgi:hypothetical protein
VRQGQEEEAEEAEEEAQQGEEKARQGRGEIATANAARVWRWEAM